jgi:PAS domain S-box-containing protein
MQLYLDLVDVMIVAMNKQGNVTLANRKTSDILGYGEESTLGRNWFNNFIHMLLLLFSLISTLSY